VLSQEKRTFFLRWLSNPRHIGVPVPSSRILARAMAAQLSVGPHEYVVELGPGTGVVTEALLQSGLTQQKLVIVERDPRFYDQLKRRFPQILILQGDARNLKELLQQHGIKQVAAIISSLPLLGMSDAIRHAIVGNAFSVIKPDGAFIQYTYGLLSPVPEQHQHSIGIQGRVAKRIWRNFPPARIWRYVAHAQARP
jgi:phosphatidylethanolamine/phosphatidyl-N-methylethanolamine N-methyltransferase